VNLIAAMLLETTHLLNTNNETRRRVSKSFWRLVEHYDKLTFMGPPENVRDHVMTATYALSQGDWKKANDTITSLKVWDLLPQKTEVLEMLTVKIKETALKIYLTVFAPHYSSIAVDQLCNMFEVDNNTVQSIASRLIISEEIQGSWHQPTQTIVMRNTGTTNLQKLALRCVDKVNILVDLNEKALGLRTGSLRERDDDDHHDRKGRRGGNQAYWDDKQKGGRGRNRREQFGRGGNRPQSLAKMHGWDKKNKDGRKGGYGGRKHGGDRHGGDRGDRGDAYSSFQTLSRK